MATRVERINNVLQAELTPIHLDIINESHMHNVPKESETHLKVVVVSSKFNGVPLVRRHQKVQELLKPELDTGLHALSIVARTEAEWEKTKTVPASPNCQGGFGK
ncbi:BolA-like protein [Orchesella cincta]|uniref:BolA-like protein n=1 Tax=Orchesella cincta TaxID=48709 RepID=A0A1D2NL60_ORCCI|nr:BolA-like protein [Orchesella cincta]